ncbi:GNAT family N-acetyltransferase [Cellulosimicrobium sp. Marseille-Q4280]|uniref:GNAT family N-acetyltransferase n=1 Tax=Cellulosimicrobium sp. Marseille-Q4280 TaxID=2937992 RepID=UPI00203D5522|nr:GNAT family N-acetyltransferase [Cellulosimicrobium sp. Marseille-Q4280]
MSPDSTTPESAIPETSRAAGAGPDVVPLASPALVASLHRDVLEPSFPPAELVGVDAFLAEHASGRLRSLGVVEDARVVAGVVGAWSPATRVLLVQYLAIAPGRRGGGIGGRLLAAALDAWSRALDPVLVLAEVEHPDHHAASAAHGDPTARLRFYARLGARVLDVPYFQPGDGPGAERVPALLLVALPHGVARDAADLPDEVPAGPLRAFLAENLRESEGRVADDGATRALLDAADGSVALVDPTDADALAGVAVGLLSDDERHAPGA